MPPRKPCAYLETTPAPDAPMSDNPSGRYCSACRGCGVGMVHCSEPEYCGGMRRMRPPVEAEAQAQEPHLDGEPTANPARR